MATSPAVTITGPQSTNSFSDQSKLWIVGPWVDYFLIVLTPVIAAPILLLLYSPPVGISAETISVVVAAIFALGHHLPGMMRAYGDRELFERFRWRFLLAPPLFFLAFFPLHTYHYALYRLIILTWATWHACMQLYGFCRIYDAKVGSTSRVTANWDWLVCLCGFVTPQLMNPGLVSLTLKHFYSIGGPRISAGVMNGIWWASLVVSVAVVIGFSQNYLTQLRRSPKPSTLKLTMLISTIGAWWFAMTCVDNLLMSIALFDVGHDIQYLVIVWLFNCRRVGANPHLGSFMRFVFRRNMVLLYVAMIAAYGAIGLIAPLVVDGMIAQFFYGIMFTSTVMHYYLDGFIWKVRESANGKSLGIAVEKDSSRRIPLAKLKIPHLIKWSPAIVVLGFLFSSDLLSPPLSTSEKNQLESVYAQSLMGTPTLPKSERERDWIYTLFENTRIVADAVPQDREVQLRYAILLANFGHIEEAAQRLETLRQRLPEDSDILVMLGGLEFSRGKTDVALKNYLAALENAKTSRQRGLANFKLGERSWYLYQKDDAESRFAEALKYDPSFSSTIDTLRKKTRNM